jgi:proteasome assembly chaperone (PAC2) family protein
LQIDLVTLRQIKAETVLLKLSATAVLQAYTSGVPPQVLLTAFDAVVTPVKVQFYQEFDPNTLIFTFQKRYESGCI